jgi:tRNA pseudouridine65 synthase
VDILYQDDVLLAVNKPSGVLVHRGWGRDERVLVDQVRAALGTDVVHPLHRLDRQTSGVVLFALNAGVAAKMGGAFEDGAIEKRYLALVRGVAPDVGRIDQPIPRREGGPRVPAVTEFRRVAAAATRPRHVSLVEAIPRTGRLHQVRRHLKHIDHPVIGDANYGKGAINREMAARYDLNRLALHAVSLTLRHPVSGTDVTVRAPLPPDLRAPLARMGMEGHLAIAESGERDPPEVSSGGGRASGL